MALAPERSISFPPANDKRHFHSACRKRRTNQRTSQNLFQWAGLEAPSPVKAAPPFDPLKLQIFARAIWKASSHAHGMLATRWLTSQGLALPDEVGIDVVRFHPALKLLGDERTPAIVWLLRDVFTDELVGIQRCYLDLDGKLIRRKTLGRSTYNCAIKLSDDAEVTTGLHIASSVDASIAAMNCGLRPVWTVPSAAALPDFPVLNGVECLTIIGGDDDAQAVADVSQRWSNAGREVRVINEDPPRSGELRGGELLRSGRQEVRPDHHQ